MDAGTVAGDMGRAVVGRVGNVGRARGGKRGDKCHQQNKKPKRGHDNGGDKGNKQPFDKRGNKQWEIIGGGECQGDDYSGRGRSKRLGA